jgi:endonuclease YncB( thermonuclease family)
MLEDNTVVIKGLVTNIVDGDTIDIKVTHIDPANKHTYRPDERIRIYGYNAPELDTPEGWTEKQELEKELLGKELTLFTRLRDKNGRIVAKIRSRE